MEVAVEIEEAIYSAVEAGGLRTAAQTYPAHAQVWESAADEASDRAGTLVAQFVVDWTRQQART